MAKVKSNRGRKTKYKPEYVEQVYSLCAEFGADDKKLAKFFDVSKVTINAWKREYPEFLTVRVIETDGNELIAVKRNDLKTSDDKRKALAIADNRLTDLSEFDNNELLGMLSELDVDMQELAGFSLDDITELEAETFEPQDGLTDDDEVPEPPKEAKTKTGDLWLLGEHRLLCGDSTKKEDVERLMDGEKAGLMNTDPPYGVSYANNERPNPGVAKPRVANDNLVDEKLQTFLEACFRIAANDALVSNAAWYMWHAHLTQGFFAAAAAAAADVILHRQIIWVKPVLLLGRGHYHWKHEPCFMGWVQGNQPPDYGLGDGERTQTTVWEVDSVTHAERKEFNHSTPKPVGLFSIPIIKHLKIGEVCYEPFAGSGPQFIAAEKTNRRCFGIEIDPVYCDVIVKRWEDYTGKKADLVNG